MRARPRAAWLPRIGAALLAGACLAAAWTGWSIVQTSAFLLDMAGHTDGIRRWLPVATFDVRTSDLTIPSREGPVAARLYETLPPASRTVVVFPGVHGGGLDEPRLALFARRLAATGLTVLSVPLPELRAFRITAWSTDLIEDVVQWAAADARVAPRGRVGVVGVSFAGGLAVVAAGRPGLSRHLSLVVSLGGHGDLGRVLRYLCTGTLPDGTVRPPHDYGVAVLALAAASRLVPADQTTALEEATLLYLTASLDEVPEQPHGRPLFAQVAARAAQMPEPSQSILDALLAHDVEALGRRLLPHVDALSADPALSPERAPAPQVPVFLIHGIADNLIPSSETPHLAAYLRRAGTPAVRTLLTPILTHLTFEGPSTWSDRWALVQMWRALRTRLD